MTQRRTRTSIIDALRAAYEMSGLNANEIEMAIGIPADSLRRFERGEQLIRLDAADRLANFLGLQLVSTAQPNRRIKVMKAPEYINRVIDSYNALSGSRIALTKGFYATLWEKAEGSGEKVQAQFHRNTSPPEFRVGVVLDAWNPTKNSRRSADYEALFANEIAKGDVERVPTRTNKNKCLMRRIPIVAGSSISHLADRVAHDAQWFVDRAKRLAT